MLRVTNNTSYRKPCCTAGAYGKMQAVVVVAPVQVLCTTTAVAPVGWGSTGRTTVRAYDKDAKSDDKVRRLRLCVVVVGTLHAAKNHSAHSDHPTDGLDNESPLTSLEMVTGVVVASRPYECML